MNLKDGDQSEIKARRERFSISLRRSENEFHFSAFRKRVMLSNNNSVSLVDLGEQCDEEKLMLFNTLQRGLREAIAAQDLPDVLRYLRTTADKLAYMNDVEGAPINEIFESGIPEQIFAILKNDKFLKSSQIVTEAVSIISNASAGKRAQIESLICMGLFPIFQDILRDGGHDSTYNVLFSLANILCEDSMFKHNFDKANLWSFIFEAVERYRFVPRVAQVSVWLFSIAMSKEPYLNHNTVNLKGTQNSPIV